MKVLFPITLVNRDIVNNDVRLKKDKRNSRGSWHSLKLKDVIRASNSQKLRLKDKDGNGKNKKGEKEASIMESIISYSMDIENTLDMGCGIGLCIRGF